MNLSRTTIAAAVVVVAMLYPHKSSTQVAPPNLAPAGTYQPIPNFIGTDAGAEFRGAVNDRFSGVQSIAPQVVNLQFINLSAEHDGLVIYCTDCQATLPCTAGGTGAWAFGIKGQWSCAAPNLAANAIFQGETCGGDMGGTFPNCSVQTVRSGMTPLVQGGNDARLNGLTGAKTDGTSSISGFNINGVINVQSYGAKCDGRPGTDGVTNSTTTFTSASANFTSVDVGRVINLASSNSLGTNLIPGNSTIASVTNSTTVVMSNAATGTANNVLWWVGTDDATALQSAINGAMTKRKTLVWPGQCASSAILTATVSGADFNGQTFPTPVIRGDGGSSSLVMLGNSAHGGLLIVASAPGTIWPSVSVQSLRIVNQETATAPYGLKLNTIANFKQSDVSVYGAGVGAKLLTDGIVLDDDQMGEIAGGSVMQTQNGLHFINDNGTCDTNVDMEIHGMTMLSNKVTPSAITTVTGATNATPIVISTAAPHGLTSGNSLTITGVGGNTNANGNWTVLVTDATHFSLIGSAGNGAYTSGGTVYPMSANVFVDTLPVTTCWTTAANIIGAASHISLHGNDLNGGATPAFVGNSTFGNSLVGVAGYSPFQAKDNDIYGFVEFTDDTRNNHGGIVLDGGTLQVGATINQGAADVITHANLLGFGMTPANAVIGTGSVGVQVVANNIFNGGSVDNSGNQNNQIGPNYGLGGIVGAQRLGGLLGLNDSTDTITLPPPAFTGNSTAWKSCMTSGSGAWNCAGVGSFSQDYIIGSGGWFSIFQSNTFPNNDATPQGHPDTHSLASFGWDGSVWSKQVKVVDSDGSMRPLASTFANLGAPGDGDIKYCSDCTIASPCASGGTGAIAKRLNSVWICN